MFTVLLLLEPQGVSYRQTLYTPIVVVWAWMSQVLDSDKSLSNALCRVIAWLAAAGEEIPSADTVCYSKARFPLTPVSVEILVQANGQSPTLRR